MNDDSILDRIAALIDREHALRELRAGDPSAGDLGPRNDHELRAAEVELDQCWDLLRQRRALREFDRDPGEATPRSPSTVENYWQ